MFEESEVLQLIDAALKESSADQSEVLVYSSDSALTRFANNHVHQNVAESNVRISTRVIVDKRIGYSSTNKVDKTSIKDLMTGAGEAARRRPPNPEFKSLPEPEAIPEADTFFNETAGYAPQARAEAVKRLIDRAREKSLVAAGSFATGGTVVGIGNSLGVRAVGRLSEASFKTVVMGTDSSGWAAAVAKNAADIDADRLAGIAVGKALESAGPIDIKPGCYAVLLSPEAVADMLSFMAYAGFSALAVQEGRSFMAGKFGDTIVDERVSVWDDALDPVTIGLPFDFEGVPKRRVDFISEGVAKSVVHDSFTAARESKRSTGHALPAPNPYGPLPTNLFMAAGDGDLQEMIGSLERGIFVTRFHYTNIEDPLKTILTGMTRDGTFLIENGKIKAGLKNLRFTQSILEALSSVRSISADRQLVESMLGAAYVPYLLSEEFNFTGATQF
ncbi:MAG: TldD/PmbA family protein [Candidatus Aquicultorales bacterium]